MEKKYIKIQSNFEKVMEFNRAFDMVELEPQFYDAHTTDENGNLIYNPFKDVRSSIFANSPKTINLRLDLINEEIEELQDAVNHNDIIEQRDACSDILYVVYGMADVLGIAIDNIFRDNLQKKIVKYYKNKEEISIKDDNVSNTSIKIITDGVSQINLTSPSVESIFDINKSKQISNFNYIKHFYNELLGFNIKDIRIYTVINYILIKINTHFTELKQICNTNLECDNNVNVNDNVNNKMVDIANKLYKILRWVYIFALVIGVDEDEDFNIVHKSNMSKLCDSEIDAKETVNDYQRKFKLGISIYDSPYYYYLPNINKWIVKNLSSGKALKNIYYKSVSFSNNRFVF